MAAATDPDGDPLSYAWSGCATGTAATATCTVPSPGTFTATVLVSDGRGGAATASKTAEGVNHAPTVVFGYPQGPQPSNAAVVVLGNGEDPDEGFLCGRQICVEARATGACRSPHLDCTCLGGIQVEVRTSTGPGACTVTVTLQDEWGLRGSGSFTFEVTAP